MNTQRRKETFATIIPQVSEASSPLSFVDGAQTGHLWLQAGGGAERMAGADGGG